MADRREQAQFYAANYMPDTRSEPMGMWLQPKIGATQAPRPIIAHRYSSRRTRCINSINRRRICGFEQGIYGFDQIRMEID